MPSQAARVLLRAVQLSNNLAISHMDLAQQRAGQELFDIIVKPPRKVKHEPFELDGLPLAWLKHDNPNPEIVALHLHGGAYVTGGAAYCKACGARFAHMLHINVLTCVYRLAPENPYPAALEDALAAYCHLLDEGHDPNNILVIGESAGGGLTVALALELKRLKLPLPRGLYLMSPWVDLTCSLESHSRNEDPVLKTEYLLQSAHMYAADHALDEPSISPLYGDVTGLPPTLIQVGTLEKLEDEALALAKKMKESGVEVAMQRAEGMWHVFQLFDMPEARAALNAARAFFGLA